MDQQQLTAAIDKVGLSDFKDLILSLVQPSIRLHSSSVLNDSQIPVGASKLGGYPDLPSHFQWPVVKGQRNEYQIITSPEQEQAFKPAHKKVIKHPLWFVAQINLAEISALELAQQYLPSAGMLYFFYRGDYPKGKLWDLWVSHVIYANEDPQSLQRRPPTMKVHVFKAAPLTAETRLTLPTFDFWEGPFNDKQDDAYCDLLDKLDRSPIHRMLGYPDPIQSNVFDEAQMMVDQKRDVTTPTDWCLLFQLDSNRHAKMNFGDAGMLYYCIPNAALQTRQFDYTTCVMQCY